MDRITTGASLIQNSSKNENVEKCLNNNKHNNNNINSDYPLTSRRTDGGKNLLPINQAWILSFNGLFPNLVSLSSLAELTFFQSTSNLSGRGQTYLRRGRDSKAIYTST